MAEQIEYRTPSQVATRTGTVLMEDARSGDANERIENYALTTG